MRHVINDSLGSISCISIAMSPGASMPFGGGVSGLLLQAVSSTNVLLEVRSSRSLPKCMALSLIGSLWVCLTTGTDNSCSSAVVRKIQILISELIRAGKAIR